MRADLNMPGLQKHLLSAVFSCAIHVTAIAAFSEMYMTVGMYPGCSVANGDHIHLQK